MVLVDKRNFVMKSKAFWIDMSNFHKLTITTLRKSAKKGTAKFVFYRDGNFSPGHFREETPIKTNITDNCSLHV